MSGAALGFLSAASRRGARPRARAILWALACFAPGCGRDAASIDAEPVASQSGERAVSGEAGAAPRAAKPGTNPAPIVVHVDGKPITASLRLPRGAAAPGDEIDLTVELSIAPMWEIQPLGVAAGGATATQLELVLPPGVTAANEWTEPTTARSMAPDGHAVHAGRVSFHRALAIAATATAGPATIVCKVAFQACNDRTCLKPQTIELSAPLSIVGP